MCLTPSHQVCVKRHHPGSHQGLGTQGSCWGLSSWAPSSGRPQELAGAQEFSRDTQLIHFGHESTVIIEELEDPS